MDSDSSYEKKMISLFFLINYLHCLYVSAWLNGFLKEATTIGRRYAYFLLWRARDEDLFPTDRTFNWHTTTTWHTNTNTRARLK